LQNNQNQLQMPNQEYHLFVYGSLRQGFNHAAYEYITQYFTLLGQGKAKGMLYDLGPYPAAIPAEDDHRIVGELYKIINPDEFEYAIAQLDDYEGVNASYDQQSLYRRELTSVKLDDGNEYNAWIYWYTGDITGRPIVESGDVLAYLKAKKNLS
jgi:gamma-glutamylcyclotransferase (GGCT)/AIG2-like uncharacterized protein YtfP